MNDATLYKTTQQRGQALAGGLALLLGFLSGTAAVCQVGLLTLILPGSGAAATVTALCFTLAGLGLLLPLWRPHREAATQLWLGGALLALAALNLLYSAFGPQPDLQQADLQRWFDGASTAPAQMSPTASAAFVLIGLVILLTRARHDTALSTVGRLALLLVLLFGTAAVIDYLLRLVDFNSGFPFDFMPLGTALGLMVVSSALWPLWRRGPGGLSPTSDRGITSTAVAVLICTALGVGLTTWVTEQQHLAAVLGDGLRQTLKSRAEQITSAIDLRIGRAAVVSARPLLVNNLRLLNQDPDNTKAREALHNILRAFEPFGFSGLQVHLADGREIFRMGELQPDTEHRLAIPPSGTALLRRDGFFLRSHIEIVDTQGAVIGTMTADQVVPDLTAAFFKLDDRGRGDELLLCGTEGEALRCFASGEAVSPSLRLSRTSADFTELAKPALEAGSGVSTLTDFRQRHRVGAYAPVGNSGLIAILKSDTQHLYEPLTLQFRRVLFLTLVLIAVGTGLIYLRVRPLLSALRLGEQRLQMALDASASHVWELNLRTQRLQPDQSLFHLLGLGDDIHPLTQAEWQQWVHPDDLPQGEAAANGWTLLQQGSGAELRLRNRQGEYRWFSFRGGIVEADTGGRPLRALGTARDITERKRMEQELVTALIAAEDANHAKSQFLSSMSHELRTPLNGVLGYVQMLLADADITPAQQRQLAGIESCGQHLLTLINDVLDLAKIESGTLEVESGDCDLYSLLDSVSDIVRERALNKKLQYSVDIDSGVPRYIRTDAIKLRQILVNLLGNAIKFTSMGSVALQVSMRAEGRELLFQVRDTGIGIPLEKQQEIFKPFRQIDRSAGGTGLGLSISQRLCEALGGKLLVRSEAGEGSCFSFSLPFEAGEATRAEPPQRLAHPTLDLRAGSLTIMVVDDNPINRQVLAGMLRANGIGVVEAEHGRDALEKLRIQPVPMILMDVRMPVMDGFAATRAIKSNPLLRATKVIAVSASVFPDTIEGMLGAGCDDFIKKPVRVRELVEKLARHLQLPLREDRSDRETSLPG